MTRLEKLRARAGEKLPAGDLAEIAAEICLLEDMTEPARAAADTIRTVIDELPDEVSRIDALRAVLHGRCRTCLEIGSRWCCYDSRGD